MTDVLGDADWDRFHSYAKRVRSLYFEEPSRYRSELDIYTLDPTVIAILSLHHPFGAVFLPRLQELSWETGGSALSMIPFLSGELKQLHLHMPTPTPSTANEVFKALAHRTPALVSFHLEATVRGLSVDTSIARWLRTTANLEAVSLPPHYLTPALVRVLGSLPKLREIEQSEYTYLSNSTRVLQCLPPGTFPKLVDISFSASLSEAQGFLLASQEVGYRLSRIVLHASGRLDSERILKFARLVTEICPALTGLGLNFSAVPRSGEQSLAPLTMALFESLYPCTQLQTLEIGHPLPFTFQEEDVEQMARAWPQMACFDVCPDPDYSFPLTSQLGSSISILSVFAKAMPELEVLSLHVNEQGAPPFTGNLYPRYQFQRLTALRFGLSLLPGGSSRQVGFYIASICKERPVISHGRTGWHSGAYPNDWIQTKRDWQEVEDTVYFAMEVKQEGLSSLRGTVA